MFILLCEIVFASTFAKRCLVMLSILDSPHLFSGHSTKSCLLFQSSHSYEGSKLGGATMSDSDQRVEELRNMIRKAEVRLGSV